MWKALGWSFAAGALPAMTTARLAQPVERKALNLVVVGSSPTVGAFEFLREAIVGAFAGGYVLLCAQARRGRGGAAALARWFVWHACARGGSSGERKHMGSKRVVFTGVCVSWTAAAWSSGMILGLGSGGRGFNSRSSPLRKQKGLQFCCGLGCSRACSTTAKHRRHFARVV